MASEAAGKEAVAVMTQLNKKGKGNTGQVYDPCMYRRYRVRASGHCGGNGFGEQSEDRAFGQKDIAYIEGAKEYAQMGLIPRGSISQQKSCRTAS